MTKQKKHTKEVKFYNKDIQIKCLMMKHLYKQLQENIDTELTKLEESLCKRINQVFQVISNMRVYNKECERSDIIEGISVLKAFHKVMKSEVSIFEVKLKKALFEYKDNKEGLFNNQFT